MADCIHTNIYYSVEADNFYCSDCNRGMGIAYYRIAIAARRLIVGGFYSGNQKSGYELNGERGYICDADAFDVLADRVPPTSPTDAITEELKTFMSDDGAEELADKINETTEREFPSAPREDFET